MFSSVFQALVDHDYRETGRVCNLVADFDQMVDKHPEVNELLQDYQQTKEKAAMFDKAV